MNLYGLSIVSSFDAETRKVEHKVERWTGKAKKRKGWQVVRLETFEPCAYRVGNTVFMHPNLVAQLPR